MEDQDPVEGGVGWVGEWGSATERLEGTRPPRAFLITPDPLGEDNG